MWCVLGMCWGFGAWTVPVVVRGVACVAAQAALVVVRWGMFKLTTSHRVGSGDVRLFGLFEIF